MKKILLFISSGTDLPKFIEKVHSFIKGEEIQLYLVHVMEEGETEKLLERIRDIGFIGGKPREALKETLHQEHLKRSQEKMDDILVQLRESGLNTIGLFRIGKVAQQVLQAATEIGADLIIISQSKKHFISSELRFILTHAPYQVKII